MPIRITSGLEENAQILQEAKSNIATAYKKLGKSGQQIVNELTAKDNELKEWIQDRKELESKTDELAKSAAAGPKEYKDAVEELKEVINSTQKVQAQIFRRVEEYLKRAVQEKPAEASATPTKVKYKGTTYIRAEGATKVDYMIESIGQKIQSENLEQLAYDAVEAAKAEGDERLAKKAEILRLALAVADGIANFRYSGVPQTAENLSTLVKEYWHK